MPSPRPSPSDVQTRERLVQAAAEVFAARGFAGARVRDVVEAAQVNVAAVNYYFGGKDGLYTAVLDHLMSRRLATAPPAPVAEESAEEALRRHVLAVVQRSLRDRETALGKIIAHESIDPSPHFDTILDAVIRPEFEALGAIVRRLLPEDTPSHEADAHAMSILAQGVFYVTARGAIGRLHPHLLEPSNAEALATHITEFSLAALRARH